MDIKKRDGSLVPFDASKIRDAVFKALSAVGMPSEFVADRVTKDVVKGIPPEPEKTLDVEDIQDMVETALMKRGLVAAAKAYILYREERSKARASLKVRRPVKNKQSVTDQQMLIVQAAATGESAPWNRDTLINDLIDTGLDKKQAKEIAKDVEFRVLDTGLHVVNDAFVRELANSVLTDKGLPNRIKEKGVYKVTKDYIDGLMFSKVNENSNIVNNNPEAVSLSTVDVVMRQYALDSVFSPEVAQAHRDARIYLHDNNFPHRVYAFSGDETAVIVKFDGYIMYVTLHELWDKLEVPEERLNDDQVRKSLDRMEVYTRDRGSWVKIEQLVRSLSARPGKRLKLDDGKHHVITNEHGVIVLRDGKYMLVRADEVRLSDRLVICKKN